MKLIDKDALVAEIERLKKSHENWSTLEKCIHKEYENLLSFIDALEVKEVEDKPVSEDLGEYINELSKRFPEVSFAKLSRIAVRVAKWQKEKIVANTADAMIGLPYENKDGKYTHLVDVSRPLPVGDNKIAIIFKED